MPDFDITSIPDIPLSPTTRRRAHSSGRSDLDAIYQDTGTKYGVDPDLLLEQGRQESHFNPTIKSPKGAAGVAQFMPDTARRFGLRVGNGVDERLDPTKAIPAQGRYMQFLLKRFGDDEAQALAGYNAGEGAVDKYHGVPPYKETRGYVKTVLGRRGAGNKFDISSLPDIPLTGEMEAPGRLADRTAQATPTAPALRPLPSVQAEAPDTNYFPQVSGLDAPSVTPPARQSEQVTTARLTRSPTRAVASRAARPAQDEITQMVMRDSARLKQQADQLADPTQVQNRVRDTSQVPTPAAAPPRRVRGQANVPLDTLRENISTQLSAPTKPGNVSRMVARAPEERMRLAELINEVASERRQQANDRAQIPDLNSGSVQAEALQRLADEQYAEAERVRLNAQATPAERAQAASIQDDLRADPKLLSAAKVGLRRAGTSTAEQLAGAASLAGRMPGVPSEVTEGTEQIADYLRRNAMLASQANEEAAKEADFNLPERAVAWGTQTAPELLKLMGATKLAGAVLPARAVAPAVFGAMSATQAAGENKSPAQIAGRAAEGAAEGALFDVAHEVPIAGEAERMGTRAGRLGVRAANTAGRMATVGGGTLALTGDPHAAASNALFAAGLPAELSGRGERAVKKGGVADEVIKPGEGNTGVAAPSTPAQLRTEALADFVDYAQANNVRLKDGNLAPPTQAVADELTTRLAALHKAGVLDNEIRAALSAPEASNEVPQTQSVSVPAVLAGPQVEAAGGQAGRSEAQITTERRATVRTPETDLRYAKGTMESIGGTLEPEANGYRLTVGDTSVTTPDISSAVAKAREFATQREIMSQVFPSEHHSASQPRRARNTKYGKRGQFNGPPSTGTVSSKLAEDERGSASGGFVSGRPADAGTIPIEAPAPQGTIGQSTTARIIAPETSQSEVGLNENAAQEPTRQDVGHDDLASVKREADEAWAKIKPLVEKPATLTRAERQRQAKLDKAVARINRPARTRPAPNSEKHSLSEFVNLSGGIRPDADNTNAGEVRRLSTREIGGRHIGLVNKHGRTADEMAELVHEGGYFAERPDPNALLAAIEADARSKQHYSAHNEKANAQVETEYNAYVQAHPEFGVVERKFEAFHNDGQAGDLYERLLYDGTESLNAEELNALRQKAKQHDIESEIEHSIANNSLANQTDDTSFNPEEYEKADSTAGVSTSGPPSGEGKRLESLRPAEQSGFGFGTLESGLFAEGGPTVEKQVAAPKPDATLSTRERLIREEAARQTQKNTEAFGADTARQLEELAETDDRAGQVAQAIIKERSRVTKPVTDTVQALRAIREAQSNNTPLNDHLKQQGLFGESLTPEVQNLARRIAIGRFNASDLSDPVKLSRLTPTERANYEEAKGNLKRTLSPDKVHDINEVMANALPEVVKIAKYHILNGAREFADFSREMVQQFGEQIRPHLERLHKLALEAIGEKNADRSTVQGVTPTSDTETQGQGEQLRQAAKGPDVSVGDGREGVTDSRASLAERGISSTVGQEVSGPTGTKNAVTERERAFPKSAAAAGFQQGTDLVYDVATNKAAEAKAEEAIKVQGADRAMSDLLTKTETTKDDIVLGETLAKKFAESGEHEREMAVIDDLAKKLTNAGQTVQAASLIAKLSPTGLKLRAQKILNKTQPGRTLTKAEGDALVETARQIQTSEGRVKELAPEVERAQSNVLVEELQTKLEQAEAKLAELEKGQTKQGVERIRAEVRRTRRAVSRAELDTEFAAIKGRLNKAWIEARKAKGALAVDPEGAITKALGEMALNRVRAGVNDAAQLVDDIYNALKDDLPGLTRREVQEKVSGYGKTAEPSKEPIRATLRDLKEQMRLALAIEDVEGKQAPRRSGYQRGQSSAKALEMRRELTEKLKVSGLEMGSRDPLPAIKRRLQQEIDRNEGKLKQLQQGTLPRRAVRPTANLDAEATKLKGERDALTQQIVAERKKFPVQGPKKPTALLTEITTRAQGKPEVLRGAELFTRQGMNPETWRAEMKQQFGLEGRAANQAYRDAYEVYTQAKQAVTQGQRLRAAEKANPQAVKSELQRLVNERLDEQTKRRKGQEDLAKQFDELSATPLRRVGRGVMEVAGLRRAARTAIDLSWGFRQGKVAFGRHPLIWARGFAKQFPAIKSKATYERMISERELDPDFKYAQRFNLFLATEGRQAGLSAREEGFQTSLAEKIPVISHSERAYNTMADEVRFQWFKQLLHTHRQLLDVEALENKQVFESLAQQINIATGRGGSAEGFLAKHGAMVNNFAFSAQFWASRLKLISQPFNPRNYTRLSEPARVEAWKNFLGYAVVVGGQLALAKASGANVDTDPHSANFLKATWGRLHVDFSAGVQGHVRAALGILKSMDMEYRQHTKAPRYHTAGDIAGTYFRGKESPDIQALHDIFLSDVNSEGFHTMVTGEPVYLAGKPGTHGLGRVRSSYWVQNAAPMIFNDAYEAFTQLNLPTAGAATAGALLGEGVQTYSPRSSGTVTIPELKRPTNRQIDFSQ